jgi:tape measure domain-containing protein
VTDIGELVVRIRADAAQLEREMQRANGVVNSTAGTWQGKFRDAGKAIKGMGIEVGGLSSALGPLIGAAGVGQIAKYSDAWRGIENRLRLVADSADELAGVSERLFNISQDTRSSLDATVALYQRLTFATKGLGVSQGEVLEFTEQLNKQLLVGGLNSTEAANAVFQLTQAFNKGKLDGDEFRTILESAPPILEALQASLKKSRGEILEMSAAGKLGPRVLIDAVNSMSDVTNARFAKMSVTMTQAFTLVENAFTKFIGQSGDVNAATGAMVDGLTLVAENMDVAGRAALALAAVITTRLALGIGASLALMNPYAAALTALVGGLTFMATASSKAEKEQAALNGHLRTASDLTKSLESSNRALAEAKTGNAKQLREENDLLKANAEERLNSLKAMVAEHETRLTLLNEANESNDALRKRSGNSLAGLFALNSSETLDKESIRELDNIAKAYEQIRSLEAAIAGNKGKSDTGSGGVAIDKAAAKKIEDARKALDDYNRSLREEGQLLGLSDRERAAQEARFRVEEIARKGNITLTKEQIEATAALAVGNYDLKKSQDEVNKATQEAIRFQQELHDKLSASLTDIVFRANSAKDAMLGFAEAIARAAFEKKIAGPFADALFGTGGGSGLLDGLFNGGGSRLLDNAGAYLGLNETYGPAMRGFADGGTPPVGIPSIVGERGPEIFVPKAAGTVIPNHALGGSTVNVYQTFQVSPGVPELINQEIRRAAPSLVTAAISGVVAESNRGGQVSRAVGRRQ